MYKRQLHDVERLADRFGLIHKGELRAVQTPGELAMQEEKVLVRTQGESAAVSGMLAEPGGRWMIELPRPQLWPASVSYTHLNALPAPPSSPK